MSEGSSASGRRPPTAALSRESRQRVRAYFDVRGERTGDALRLFAGYTASVFRKLVRPATFTCVGASIPGASRLTVHLHGMMASVRPGTNDLDILVHHEPQTREWFAVRPGDRVVDVGSHIGLYTLLAAGSGATVIAIEPDPENRAVLAANVEQNRFMHVRVVPVAVSNRTGWVILHRPDGPNRGTACVSEVPPDSGGVDSRDLAVPCDTLDRLLPAYGFDRIDWLKVDVEGHEVAALEGGRETLRHVRQLILEVTAASAEACLKLATDAGLRLVAEERGHPARNWLLVRDGA